MLNCKCSGFNEILVTSTVQRTVKFIGYLNIWEHVFWNKVGIHQCPLHSGRNTFVGILIIPRSVVVLRALIGRPLYVVGSFLDEYCYWIWGKSYLDVTNFSEV